MIKGLLDCKWTSILSNYSKLVVGFSGGLDSTVLLHALQQIDCLKDRLIAVHVNHQISNNADVWQEHCDIQCQKLGITFQAYRLEGREWSSNIEEEARNARYAIFNALLLPEDCLLVAHHQDDQAETLLLNLLRGAGVEGLAAMAEFSSHGVATLVRPLLSCTREQLEDYAIQHQLSWIEDESNQDTSYSRNYLRLEIIPFLKNKWPRLVNTLTRAADHCQQAKKNLEDLAYIDAKNQSLIGSYLDISALKELSRERLCNILRVWLRNNGIQSPSTSIFQGLIDELIFAKRDSTPLMYWKDIALRRYKEGLYLLKPRPVHPTSIDWPNFPSPLVINQLNLELRATTAKEGIRVPKDATIRIGFREGGECFLWHGQKKQLKKLFQEWDIPPWERARIPLLYINRQLAAIFLIQEQTADNPRSNKVVISDTYYTQDEAEAWELSLVIINTQDD